MQITFSKPRSSNIVISFAGPTLVAYNKGDQFFNHDIRTKLCRIGIVTQPNFATDFIVNEASTGFGNFTEYSGKTIVQIFIFIDMTSALVKGNRVAICADYEGR